MWKEIKEQWTWSGIKQSFKKDWPSLFTVFISGILTCYVLDWFELGHGVIRFIGIQAIILLLLHGIIAGVLGMIGKIKK